MGGGQFSAEKNYSTRACHALVECVARRRSREPVPSRGSIGGVSNAVCSLDCHVSCIK